MSGTTSTQIKTLPWVPKDTFPLTGTTSPQTKTLPCVPKNTLPMTDLKLNLPKSQPDRLEQHKTFEDRVKELMPLCELLKLEQSPEAIEYTTAQIKDKINKADDRMVVYGALIQSMTQVLSKKCPEVDRYFKIILSEMVKLTQDHEDLEKILGGTSMNFYESQ